MRKILSALLCILLISVLTAGVISPAQAVKDTQAIYANENYVYTFTPEGDIEILRYIGENRRPQIPLKIDGRQVVSLGDYSFMGTDIISISLPSSLNTVGEDAFYDCQSLKEVTISDGISVFKKNVFRNCKNLTTVNFDENVTSLGTAMFYGCISLETITLPDGIRKIPDYAFACCENLKNADYPDTLEEIGEYAFFFSSVNDYYSLPKSLRTIKSHAFDSTDIVYLRLPDGLETVESRSFANCENLKVIVIPSSVATIDSLAFANCTNLETIKIPNPNQQLTVAENALQGTPLEEDFSYIFPVSDKITYYFCMPDSWRLGVSSISIRWNEKAEDTEYPCSFQGRIHDSYYVYVCKVPAGVTEIIFDTTDPQHSGYRKTVPIKLDGYKPGEDSVYPDGLESFEGMIYVLDYYEALYSPEARGEWYYYYGDGYYGTTPELNWNGDVFYGPATGMPDVAPTETTPSEHEPQATPPAPSLPAESVCPTENESTKPGGSCGTPSATPDEPSIDFPTTSDTWFEQEEKAHRAEVYDTLRKNMEVWASLGWDVRIRGDVNGDLTVNIKDATLIQKHLAGLDARNILLKNADVNTDGSVNIRDATLIQKKVAGLIDSFD